ncbi:MAG: DUF1015 domain-containing protein [Putridiphycobacter sp.]
MAKILPFKAIRPTRDKAQLVTSRPYYVYSKLMLDAKLVGNPYSFIHIINPEFHEIEKTEPNSPERFQKVRNKFEEFFNEGIFLKEEKPSLYIYKKTTPNHEYIGVIGGASIDDYNNGHIKKHEQTLTERETVFSNYLKVVEFNAEPVLLFHDNREKLNHLLLKLTFERPEYEFTTTDKVKHELWVISEENDINAIQKIYNDIDDVYIADGHHRSASSARFYEESQNKTENKGHFLAYYISSDKLNILDYNRLIKGLNELSKTKLLEAIEKDFIISKLEEENPVSKGLHNILMYLENDWYNLQAKENIINRDDPVKSLDTYILSHYILKPILGIKSLKTDERVGFINGRKGMDGIKKLIDNKQYNIGFGLAPVSPKQLKDVADANLIMPPKSTWIEPKLRSALVIYPLNE